LIDLIESTGAAAPVLLVMLSDGGRNRALRDIQVHTGGA